MFSNKGSNTYLSKILDKQNEILTELKDINNNIIKYFGDENDLKEKTLIQNIKNAHFTKNQFDVLKEVVEHTREKHSKNNKEECEHTWIYDGANITTAGKDEYFHCYKCGAKKMVNNNNLIYESSSKWQT